MPDVLEQRGGTRRSGLLLVVAVVVVAVGGAVVWVEGARREPGEREALTACAVAADEAVERAEARLSNRANYVRPLLGTTSDSVEAALLRLIANEAPTAQSLVDRAARTCRDVDVWLLHGELREARDAQLDLLAAEQRRLAAVAADGAAYFTGWEEIGDLRRRAADLRP